MPAFAIDCERRWHPMPWGWRCLWRLSSCDLQPSDFVERNRLKPWIRHWQRTAGKCVPHLELVFGVRLLSYSEKKLPGLLADPAAYQQGVAQIVVTALIKRTGQTDARLHGEHQPLPANLLDRFAHAATRCQLY